MAQKAPFDIIIVAAAPDHVPQPLVDQLARGGRLVIPVGGFFQQLLVIEKQKDGKHPPPVDCPRAVRPDAGRGGRDSGQVNQGGICLRATARDDVGPSHPPVSRR